MKSGIRLITKIRLSMVGIALCLLAFLLGGILFTQSDDPFVYQIGLGVLVFFFIRAFVEIIFFLSSYINRRTEAWREEFRARRISDEELLKKMQGSASHREHYILRHAILLARLCTSRIFFVMELPENELRILSFLEEEGWIRLTLDTKTFGRPVPVFEPTDRTWSVVDDLRPHDWSPEDSEHRAVPAPSPA